MSAAEQPATPQCVHFGVCGGCQYQDRPYEEQLQRKRAVLAETMAAAGVLCSAEIALHSGAAYHYRNRIRLRLLRVAGELRAGYHTGGGAEIVPVRMCPIAAPLLWKTAEALLHAQHPAALAWLEAAEEVELFCDAEESQVQVTLLCGRRSALGAEGLEQLRRALPQIAGVGAMLVDRQRRPLRLLAEAGAPGLLYRVAEEAYWVSRGGFFQVNRSLLPALVRLVCAERRGELAWDLFAGVGLFSRVLARSFSRVTAVEANPLAVADLRAGLARLGAAHTAVAATTLEFLRAARVQRERPELVVLDPPRAGAGAEACELLKEFAPQAMVYVSCDPATLAADLATLQESYHLRELHLVDLFPQTFHLETVAMLERR